MKKDKIIAELKKISKKNKGILKPEVVVKTAENKNNILHNYFEWDNDKAGHAYRVWQARQLISVSVQYSEATQQSYEVFVSLSPDRKSGGYREIDNVLNDETLKKILLTDALNEMNLFIEKYKQLRELCTVFDSMKATTKKYTQKKETKDYVISPQVSPVAV